MTSSAADGVTVIRDAASLRPVRRLRGGGTPSAISPDGRVLAELGAADGSVRLLDLHTGIPRVATDRHDGAVTDLRFTPDSRTLLTAGSDGRVIRWNVADAQRIETFAGHAGTVSGVAIAPDGKTAYSAGEDGKVIAWDLAGNRRLARPFNAPPGGGVVLPAQERGTNPADLAPMGNSLPYAGLAVAATPDEQHFAVPDDAGYVDVFDGRPRWRWRVASRSAPGRRSPPSRSRPTGGPWRPRRPTVACASRRPERTARAAAAGLRHRPYRSRGMVARVQRRRALARHRRHFERAAARAIALVGRPPSPGRQQLPTAAESARLGCGVQPRRHKARGGHARRHRRYRDRDPVRAAAHAPDDGGCPPGESRAVLPRRSPAGVRRRAKVVSGCTTPTRGSRAAVRSPPTPVP